MNSNQESNILAFQAASALERYAAYATGTPNGTLAIISRHPLGESARDALEKSADRLGFGAAGIIWMTCEPDAAPALSTSGARELLTALDPLAFVATDATSTELLSTAFEEPVERDAFGRLQCRNVAAFTDFANMLNTPEDKQRAWALLKQLT